MSTARPVRRARGHRRGRPARRAGGARRLARRPPRSAAGERRWQGRRSRFASGPRASISSSGSSPGPAPISPRPAGGSARPSVARSSGCSGCGARRSPSSSTASARRWRPRNGRTSPARSDRIRSLRAGRRVALAAVFEADFGQRTPTAVLERDLAEVEADPGRGELARAIVGCGGRESARHRRAESRRRRPNIRSSSWPGWTVRCSVARWVRCYIPRRLQGWPSPSGSNWPGSTVATRCDAS